MKSTKKDLKAKLTHRKIKKPNPILMSIGMGVLGMLNRSYGVKFIYDYDPKTIEGQPVILLSSHASRLEFIYTVYGFGRKDVNVVCGFQNILKKGVYVEFDNFGKEYHVRREVRNSGYGLFVSDIERVKLVKKLVDEGYINQLLMSCDVCLKNILRTYGGYGYDHVLRNVLPMLEEEGLTKEQIDRIIRINPIEFLLQGE